MLAKCFKSVYQRSAQWVKQDRAWQHTHVILTSWSDEERRETLHGTMESRTLRKWPENWKLPHLEISQITESDLPDFLANKQTV